MRRDECDFSRVPARQDVIHRRLEHWAIWVMPRAQAWKMQPMFRLYRSDQWYKRNGPARIEVDSLECHETERAVSFLPEKHRYAIRWAYVAPWIPVNVIRRELASTRDGLAALIMDGRDMLKNRLADKLQER